MDYKEKISWLTEELLASVKKYNANKDKLKFEMDHKVLAAQIAVNIMFDTKITPGPLCMQALDAHDRSVTNWLKKLDVQNKVSAI